MSNEDDTFAALKKWTFDEINDAWNTPFPAWPAGGWDSIIERAGWTNDEFWTKRNELRRKELRARGRDIRRPS